MPFTQDFLQVVVSNTNSFVPEAMLYYSLRFVDQALQTKNTFNFLHPNLENLVY